MPCLLKDRRQESRHDSPVKVWYRRAGSGRFHHSDVINLSQGGARLLVDEPFEACHIVAKNEKGQMVTARARRAWFRPVLGGRRYLVGLSFEELASERLSRWFRGVLYG